MRVNVERARTRTVYVSCYNVDVCVCVCVCVCLYCTDINECACNWGVCDDRAMCTNTNGSHDCSCLPGFADYTGDGCRGLIRGHIVGLGLGDVKWA